MTAEVVIMNKLGMSMAADSAITSGVEGVQKVYHSANKLFPLTESHPIGVMVYGSASFMETPWEVMIKSYRNVLGERYFDDVGQYAEDFFNFLKRDRRINHPEIEDIIVYRTFSEALKRLITRVEDQLEADDIEAVDEKTVLKYLEDELKAEVKTLKNKDTIINIELKPFEEKFKTTIREIIEEYIDFKLPKSLEREIINYAFEMLKRDHFSPGSTGIVIAGYGEEEIFPHLVNYRLEGFVLGELKYKKLKERKIDYRQDHYDGTAVIAAFAQREMVDSFLYGIEPQMKATIFAIIEKVLSKYPEHFQKLLNIKLSEKQVSQVRELGNDLYQSISDTLEEYQNGEYYDPLLSIVRALPKDELANMAEALMNLTSFRRKHTRSTESVGPPIDVAVISKGDGFVWVKRKSYYDETLN